MRMERRWIRVYEIGGEEEGRRKRGQKLWLGHTVWLGQYLALY
jgi:hypothetical protein